MHSKRPVALRPGRSPAERQKIERVLQLLQRHAGSPATNITSGIMHRGSGSVGNWRSGGQLLPRSEMSVYTVTRSSPATNDMILYRDDVSGPFPRRLPRVGFVPAIAGKKLSVGSSSRFSAAPVPARCRRH